MTLGTEKTKKSLQIIVLLLAITVPFIVNDGLKKGQVNAAETFCQTFEGILNEAIQTPPNNVRRNIDFPDNLVAIGSHGLDIIARYTKKGLFGERREVETTMTFSGIDSIVLSGFTFGKGTFEVHAYVTQSNFLYIEATKVT